MIIFTGPQLALTIYKQMRVTDPVSQGLWFYKYNATMKKTDVSCNSKRLCDTSIISKPS